MSMLVIQFLTEIETITHLFVDCEKLLIFWNSISQWLKKLGYRQTSLNKEKILFGFTERDSNVKLIILCAKYIIFKNQKKGKIPHIQEVKFFLKKQLEAEEYTARIKMNMEKFLGKWAHIYNELKRM